MKTIEIKAYSFEELTPEAQQKAINNKRLEIDHYHIWQEAEETAKAFQDAFNLLPGFNSWLEFRSNFDESITELKGLRLRTYLINNFDDILSPGKYYGKLSEYHKDGQKIERSKAHPAGLRHIKRYSKVIKDDINACIFTGIYFDAEILQPLKDYIKADFKYLDVNIEELFKNCFKSLRYAIEREIEGREEDEYLIEILSDEGEIFTEEGEEI